MESVIDLLSSYINKKKLIKKKYLHILPDTVEEVQNILQVTSKQNIELSIQSKGKDWGYSIYKEGDLILDLGNMNKIIEFNEELAYIRIEPGVTFQQVSEYLKKKNSNLIVTVTGGPSDGSIIATTLMRGAGKGLQGDLFNYCCNLEGVLKSGKIINTGFGGYQNAVSQNVHRWGNGPSLDGLFSQSNLAVITKMTIWLVPKPKYYTIFSFGLKTNTQLKKFIPVIQKLKLHRILEGNFHLANNYRILSLKRQYPWELTSKTPLDADIMQQIGPKEKWISSLMSYSENKEILQAKHNIILKELLPVVNNLKVITSEAIEQSKKVGKPIEGIEDIPFLGVPTDKALKTLYWRKKHPIPVDIDPIRDNCGILWINGVIPLNDKLIDQVVKIVEKQFKQFKFEPNMALSFISERAVYFIGMIIFDKDIEDEDVRANRCYQSTHSKLAEIGVYPYRLSSEEIRIKNSQLKNMLSKII